MEEKIYLGYLYDFYGELLSEHRREIFESYIIEDLSLSEIAEECGITRQGVHDVIKRSTKSLEDYENKLHLVEKFMSIKDNIHRINELTESNDVRSLEKVRDISNKILEEL